jgi:signal transduction histidine kinase/ActR/RegA family two-component response regulator
VLKPFRHLRTKLLASMVALVILLTVAVLGLVQATMKSHVRQDLIATLHSEAAVFMAVEEAHRGQTKDGAALLANQPSLKAMMSTNDRRTVEDASASILDNANADLLVLENADGEVLAFHCKSDDVSASKIQRLMRGSTGEHDWWFATGHLYDVSFAPITAGADTTQRFLGRLAFGRELSRRSVADSGAFGRSGFIFVREGRVLLSSLDATLWPQFELAPHSNIGANKAPQIEEMEFAGERYVANVTVLSGDHPVELYSLQSFDQATSFLKSLNQTMLILGAVAVLAGASLASVLSRQITRPLELLVRGTRQLEKGDFEHPIAIQGADEVADLTKAFEHMRNSLRQSREGLVRSARLEAVGRLSGGVAHDFNNLVMIIKGYSELLLDKATPEARPHLEEIKKAGERASGLTRQLLAFSRKQVLEPQVLDPNQTVRNMAKMLRVLIGEDVDLATNFSDQIGRVLVDPGQLEQVIMNLAVNARDAMPGGGKLTIETQPCQLDEAYAANNPEVKPGPYVLISVADTGCGMSREVLTQIFEPFFTTKAPGKGTGLGLSTVYGIVKQSQGHIAVESEPGKGTTFKVYLPSHDKKIPVAAASQAGVKPTGNGTILLVEDEPALRALSAESLTRLGYTVLQAGNGLEGLAVADRHRGDIHVVVTDVVMPRMGGPQFVENLKEKRPSVLVIYASGYTDTASLENSGIGSDSVLLHKPFSTDVLARKIRELLSESYGHRAAAAGQL